MNIHDDAQSLQSDLAQLRRELHQIPEVGLELPKTQELVYAELEGLGLELLTGTATTSITGVLRGAQRSETTKTVLLRGDMDALPVAEETGLDFASTNGNMHACGHDLHTAALVGAAKLLSAHKDALAGDVVFMFQPGEEGYDGAAVMIEEGVLDAAGPRADYAYGIHVMSGLIPGGTFMSKPGPLMSAAYELDVVVRGSGGHGSMPNMTKDPVSAMAEMITALQTMISRKFSMFEPVVLSVGVVEAGRARNVIPETTRFAATVRAYSAETEERLTRLIPTVLNGVAAAHEVEVEATFTPGYPVTVNDDEQAAFAQSVIEEVLGESRFNLMPNPSTGSEDFSRVLDAVPGAFVFLGACPDERDLSAAAPNHSPHASFDDSVLADSATVYCELALRRLATP